MMNNKEYVYPFTMTFTGFRDRNNEYYSDKIEVDDLLTERELINIIKNRFELRRVSLNHSQRMHACNEFIEAIYSVNVFAFLSNQGYELVSIFNKGESNTPYCLMKKSKKEVY